MFRSKPLIATPREAKQPANHRLEFTPLGGESKHSQYADGSMQKKKNGKQDAAIHNLINNSNSYNRRALKPHNSPQDNKLNGGSSFLEESTYDSIIQDTLRQQHDSEGKSSYSPIHNDFNNRDLLNNGSNPVRQQQEEISELKSENYNLKVKIASLNKYLNAISTHDQQFIYEENSKLQEQIIAYRSEISQLNRELSCQKEPVSHVQEDSSELNLLQEKLNREMEENDRLREDIEAQFMDLEELQDSHKSLKKSKEELERENLELEERLRELENTERSRARSSSPVSKTLLSELYAKIEDLQNVNEDKDHEIRRCENEIDEKADLIEDLEQKLRDWEQRSFHDTAAESKLEELKYLLHDRDSKIAQQDRELQLIKDELEHSKSKTSKSLHEVQDLTSALHNAERKLSLLEEEQANRSNGDHSAQQILNLKREKIELETGLESLKSKIRESKSIIEEQNDVIEELKQSSYKLEETNRERERLMIKIEQLERENERTYKAYNDLKKSSHSSQKSEHDERYWKAEIDLLSNQIEDLNFENNKLQQDLDRQRANKLGNDDSYAKLEVKSLSARCNELQMELSDKENSLQRLSSSHKREQERYKSLLQEREDELVKLKDEIRSLKISTTQKIDDEKIELLRLKGSKEGQVKLLQIELENIKEQNKIEVQSLKSIIEKLRKDTPKNDSFKETHIDKSEQLLQSITDKNNRIKFLTEKLTKSLVSIKELQSIISSLERSREDLKLDNKKLESDVDQLSAKIYEQKRDIQNLVDNAVDYNDYDSIRMKLKLRERQIEELDQLKRELTMKIREVSDENDSLQGKIEKIVKKYRQLQNSVNDTVSQSRSLVKLQEKADLYKMKNTKASYKIRDLQFINNFMVKSIQSSNNHIKQDIKKMQAVGIYPDYDLICRKKLSLSVLFKFVVAAVRIKRKTEHSAKRNERIELLELKLL